jgi:hypothetical protein
VSLPPVTLHQAPRHQRPAVDQHEEDQLECNDTTTGGGVIMPIDIRTEPTTRSMIRNGRNSRKPISKARFV